MRRKQAVARDSTAPSDPAAPGKPPHVIDPHAVYDMRTAAACLGLAKHCLPREIRLGRLRASKRGGRYLLLGAWLLQWVQDGEVRRRRVTVNTGNGEPSAAQNGMS
jgi:hypothetical protein